MTTEPLDVRVSTTLQEARTGHESSDDGVEGNSRLTASAGAVIFVLLAIEGVTVLRVHSLFRLHVIIGMVLVPVVLLKVATTAYRAARYYLNSPAYRRRGPPPLVLRVLGPVVVLSTVAVLLTGIALLLLGPDHRSPWLVIHKVSFIIWFVVMTVHVLGHIIETVRIAPRDWALHGPRVARAGMRRSAVVVALLAGVVLAVLIEPSVTTWLDATTHVPVDG
jgi:hypothetical protein